jgi:TldD protein
MSNIDFNELIDQKKASGADFAEVYLEYREHTGVKLEDNRLEAVSSGIDTGTAVRTWYGDRTDYEYDNTANIDVKPALPPLKDIVSSLKAANKTARKVSSKVVQVTVSYAETRQDIVIASDQAPAVTDHRHRSRFAVQVIAQDENGIQTGYEAPGVTGSYADLFAQHDATALARTAAERAVCMLDARPAPAGEMPVVLLSEAGGTMIHEACGHALEADFILKETSIFRDKLGQQVASPLVTVIDDASLPGRFGSFQFDDEGTPGQKTVLIDQGILKGFMTDKFTAERLGLPHTGNGRRQSFRSRPVPRMTNTFIAPGQEDPAEIIKSVDKGLLVKRMGGGQVDVTNGEFVFEISEGYLIENGQVAEPVRGATLIGTGPQVLQSIDRVGSDLDFQVGICGKYDHVPVADAQPTLRIPKIIVGGRQE